MASSSLQTTLALLEGPTKAVVASAISAAGLGSALWALSPDEALCYTFRPAYDDDVFKAVNSGATGGPDFSATYGFGAQSVGTYSKPLRPIGSEAFTRLTSTRNILITWTRNVAISSLIIVNRHLTAMYEAEEEAAAAGADPVYPPLPLSELEAGAKAGSFNACLDWAVQAVRALLDTAAAARLPPSLSRRLRKDLRSSAMRKGKYAFYSRVPRVVRTALFSEATLYMADWVVACVMEAVNAARKPVAGRSVALRARLLAMRWGLQAGRCAAVWVAVSGGNGVGSAVPTAYRSFAMFLCAQVAAMGTNMYANAFIARLTAGGPPPPLPPPAVGPPVPPAPAPDGDAGEPAREALAQAIADVLNIQLGAPDAAAAGEAAEEIEPAVPAPAAPALALPDEAPPPPEPEAPAVQEARRAPRAGPRLPDRPVPRRNGLAPAGAAAAGPGTPQAGRDPPRPVAAEPEAAVEPEAAALAVEAPALPGEAEEEEVDIAVPLEPDEEEEVDIAVPLEPEVPAAPADVAGVLPPATPPTADNDPGGVRA